MGLVAPMWLIYRAASLVGRMALVAVAVFKRSVRRQNCFRSSLTYGLCHALDTMELGTND